MQSHILHMLAEYLNIFPNLLSMKYQLLWFLLIIIFKNMFPSSKEDHNLQQKHLVSRQSPQPRPYSQIQLQNPQSFQDFRKKSSKKKMYSFPLSRINKKNKDQDRWETQQVAQLFDYYNAHGPSWKNMCDLLPQKSSNTIKNKFYTVLRNLLKILFRKNQGKCPKLTGEVSSKDLCRLYDGREKYIQFEGLLKQALQRIGYDLENQEIKTFVDEKSEEILNIYQEIYSERLQTRRPEASQNQQRAQKNKETVSPSSVSFAPMAPFMDNQEERDGEIVQNYQNGMNWGYNYYFLPFSGPFLPSSYYW